MPNKVVTMTPIEIEMFVEQPKPLPITLAGTFSSIILGAHVRINPAAIPKPNLPTTMAQKFETAQSKEKPTPIKFANIISLILLYCIIFPPKIDPREIPTLAAVFKIVKFVFLTSQPSSSPSHIDNYTASALMH